MSKTNRRRNRRNKQLGSGSIIRSVSNAVTDHFPEHVIAMIVDDTICDIKRNNLRDKIKNRIVGIRYFASNPEVPTVMVLITATLPPEYLDIVKAKSNSDGLADWYVLVMLESEMPPDHAKYADEVCAMA